MLYSTEKRAANEARERQTETDRISHKTKFDEMSLINVLISSKVVDRLGKK